MTDSARNLTVEDALRARGLDPRLVKFGRLAGPGTGNPLRMTVEEFERAAIGGRALDAADMWFAGLEQQYRRSCTTLPEDTSLRDVLAHMADVELSLVLLLRLRRAAVLVREHVEGCEGLESAIRAFDTAVPDIKHLRDTQEHFDDYILGKGRHEPKAGVSRAYASPPGGPPIVQRGERKVDLGVAVKAARELYERMYQVAMGRRPYLLGEGS